MKRLHPFLMMLTSALAIHAADSAGLVNGHPADIKTLKIGDPAPEFDLIGIDGKMHKLDEYKGGKVLVVLFTSNHCPTSHGMEPRLKRFYEEYTPKGVKLVAINPNHPDGLSNDELGYGEFGDSYEEMKSYAAKNAWKFDYLYDGDKQLVARAYGCLATPHAFVFDSDLKLRYAGRFDDSRFNDESTVKSKDLQNAVDAILAGAPVPVEITRPHGCSTKWREKKVLAEAIHERWARTPVKVETIDAEGIAKLTVDDLKELVNRFKALIKERTGGKEFPQDPWKQLQGAVGAVFGSWMNDRAIVYRRKYGIPHEWGTAVNVQAMVYGNTGDNSGSGVAFTRDPATGEKVFYGEFLINAQGEDVVAGIRTPEPVAQLKGHMPKAFAELENIRKTLERHFKDVQDFEFTIQEGKVFMLQTRNGKRTGLAAVRFAIEMEKEKLIDWKTAIKCVPGDQLDQVLAPVFDRKAVKAAQCIAKGLPAGPGAASGKMYLNAERAAAAAAKGERVLLVRNETTPEDLRGMIAAEGILTAKGGVSSHAALVARQMGKVCVCGAGALQIDYGAKTLAVNGSTYKEGDYLSISGTAGEVYPGELKTAASEIVQVLVEKSLDAKQSQTYQMFKKLMDWCSKVSRLQVRTNADTPEQTENALAFGATGIGLTRTEHMFFEGNRIDAMREMILADNLDDRKKALAKLLPYQREDFIGIFKALKGFPATIRFLDPPLHEFLPHEDLAQKDLAEKMGTPVEKIKQRVKELHEFNPMLGFRGCRLGIVYSEISEMQARAVFEAAAEVQKAGIKVKPEVMIPLVGFKKELDLQVEVVHRVAKEVMAEKKVKLNYLVGTMIEVPRGALTADEIAQSAEFFSFGTNDLTQTCLGMSRDDSGTFLPAYAEMEITKTNPFASIDQTGVGQLMKIAAEKGNATRPGIKLGICGEHGGDPASVKFCHRIGLTYVSCSPYRVPVARLAAAQAALEDAAAKPAKKK